MPIIVNPDIGIQQNTTGASRIPVGTTGERPSSPTNGQIRFNTTLNEFEAYDGTDWVVFAAPGSATAAANSLVRSDSQGKIDRDYLPSVDQPVYYVSKDGEDTVNRTGQAENDAWLTIRFALEQITGPATLYVKSGVYEEVLPLTVPAEVAVIGDNQRTTEVKPAAGLGDNSIPNINQTMWRVNNGAMLTNMVFSGLTGFTVGSTPDDPSSYTVQGVYVALDPNNPITSKSPYIFDCAAFSSGAVGAYADGSIHASGNKSMLLHAYTVIIDDGVAFWAADNARMEIVSGFSYYNHVGYLATDGGTIRSLNGNCSYGTYGALSDGFDTTETTVDGAVYGEQIEYDPDTLVGEFTDGVTVTGATSGATGTVTNAQTSADKVYYLSSNAEEFQAGETISDGLGNSATIVAGGVTGQKGFVIVADGFDSLPQPGASIQFAGDSSSYVISTVSGSYEDSESVLIIVLAGEKAVPSSDNTAITIRRRFSQVRLTGHDFLSVGTGNRTQTNYPDAGFYPPIQGNEVVENRPGRVYYVSTDQDGNFRVGDYFRVDQATGRATLDASAFDLSGLTSLRLGSIGAQVGELINEFSSDVTMSGNSNEAVPTEFAVRNYFTEIRTDVVPNEDLTYNLGSAAKRWNELYVGPGSIKLGDLVLQEINGALRVERSDSSVASIDINEIDTGAVRFFDNNIIGQRSNEDINIEANGTGIIRFGSDISGPSTFVIDPATEGDNTGTVVISGNLQVDGVTTSVASTTVEVADKNIELGSTDTPSDATADGGGITLKGDSNKTIAWSNTTGRWSFNVGVDAAGIEDTPIGGSTPASGSFTSLSSSSTTTLNGTAIPTSKTLVTTDDSQSLSNKTIDLTNNNLSGSVTEFNSALEGDDFATLAGTENLQNKTLTAPIVSGDLDVDSGTLFVDSANNRVGVGTSSPSQALDVAGDVSVSSSLRFRANAQNTIISQLDDGNHKPLVLDSVRSIFNIEGSEAARIDSNGNFGIGTASPSEKLTVNGNISADSNAVSDIGSDSVRFKDGYFSGTLYAASGFSETSTIRVKENVEPIQNAIDTVMKLTGVTFDRTDNHKTNEPGLIAEEVERIIPNLVSRDAQGAADGVYYSKLTAYLIEAVKSLKSETEDLKQAIRDLGKS